MSSLISLLIDQLGGDAVSDIAGQIGGDGESTQRAIAAALPLLLGALTRNSSSSEGAASLHRALARDHDGSLLDDLGGYLKKPDTQTGDGILRHALGDRRGTVEKGLSRSSGIDPAAAGKLVAMLAPVVMGALGKARREHDLDEAGLAGMLNAEQSLAEAAAPELKGLGRLLDRDSDGDLTDDLLDIGGGLVGKLFGGR